MYTYSKSIDNSNTLSSVVAQNYLDLSAERGLSNFDRRHALNAFYVLTSPVGDNSAWIAAKGWSGRMLRDWTLNGNVSLMSGAPLTATVLGNRADSGTGVVGSTRADATGQPVDNGSGYFNPAAFAVPLSGQLGNAGRNTIPGPGTFLVGMSFGRTFRIKDSRRSLDLRLNTSNTLNHVNISRFGTTVNALNYDLATAAGGMRSMFLTVRFRF